MTQRLIGVYFDKQDVTLKGKYPVIYPKHSIAVVGARLTRQVITEKIGMPFYLDEIFKRFRYGDPHGKVFSHMSQGIGDMIAFSSITAFLSPMLIQVHVDPRFYTLFDWFAGGNMTLTPFHYPIVRDFTHGNRLTKYKNICRVAIEYAVNSAGGKNWFEVYYGCIGLEPDSDLCRPRLKVPEKVRGVERVKKTVLLCNRSSCQIRSSSLQDFYEPVREAYPDFKVLVHEKNLTRPDRDYMATLPEDSITVIPPSNFEGFLLDLYTHEMVVSTDTAAIHFREGLGLPAVGVYGGFTVDSRTRDYKYTRSFDTSHPCPHKPCFRHESEDERYCQLHTDGMETAPCQSGEGFRKQLYEQLKNYKP